MATHQNNSASDSTPTSAAASDHAAAQYGAPAYDAEVGFSPFAGVLAFLVPGLGHFYRGEKARGLLVFVGIMGMFLGGVFIGGAGVVDRYRDGGGLWWFRGQALAGPVVFAADWFTQNRLKAYPIRPVSTTPAGEPVYSVSQAELAPSRKRLLWPGETLEVREITTSTGQKINLPVAVPAPDGAGPIARQPLGREADIATLYVLCAGMLNLIAILDCLFPVARRSIDEGKARGIGADTEGGSA